MKLLCKLWKMSASVKPKESGPKNLTATRSNQDCAVLFFFFVFFLLAKIFHLIVRRIRSITYFDLDVGLEVVKYRPGLSISEAWLLHGPHNDRGIIKQI